jgi:hypothetical protein
LRKVYQLRRFFWCGREGDQDNMKETAVFFVKSIAGAWGDQA